MESNPHKRLALAVIAKAVEDALLFAKPPTEEGNSLYINFDEGRSAVYFLLHPESPITRFWCLLAEIDPFSLKRKALRKGIVYR